MEKTTGTMNKIAAWGDQKVAGLFRDLKKEEPAQDPAPCRALFRVLYLIILIIGLSLSLAYLFWEAPDVRIKQISNLQGKHKDYPVSKLYNKSSSDKQFGVPISCPCTMTSINIMDILNFYVLYEDSPEWSIGYDASVLPPSIIVPDFNISENQLAGHVQQDPVPLTADMFCNSSYLWPVNSISGLQMSSMCQLAARVIPNPNSADSVGRKIPLETPDLLNEEALASSILQLVQENLAGIQSLIAMDVVNATAAMYGNALISFLMSVPIHYGVGDPWAVYYLGATNQTSRLKKLELYGSSNSSVLGFNTSKGIGFLQMSANWTKYYEELCQPLFCEETKSMGYLNKLYWAVGLLGGIVTIVLGLVNIVLWPFTVFVLSWVYTNHRG